jgi:hypothetical protein
MDARVKGGGAEGFICCDARERVESEGVYRLYRDGQNDLIGYRVTEWHDLRPRRDPYFIVFAVYEAGYGAQFGNPGFDQEDEFIAIAPVGGMLKVKQWAREGTD